MAARNVPVHRAWTPDKVRERIQVSMIVNRLSDHVRGKVKLTAAQVRSAEVLLRKCVPDLSAVAVSGEVVQRYVIEAPKPAVDAQTWQQQNFPQITRQ